MPTESKPPRTQRTFSSAWGELSYLCSKIHYWLYTRTQRSSAGRYLRRLRRALRDLPDNDMAIIREEALALRCELEGELRKAIAHRQREVQLMERLHAEARSPHYADSTRAYMLRDRDDATLQERRAILEALKKAAIEGNHHAHSQ